MRILFGLGILAMVAMAGCGQKDAPKAEPNAMEPPAAGSLGFDPADPNHIKIEAAIRRQLKKPEGELTAAELATVKALNLAFNPKLIKAEIAALQKALPDCDIRHNARE